MGGNRQTHSQPSRTSTFPVMGYPCLFVRNVSIAIHSRKRGKINASRSYLSSPLLSSSLCSFCISFSPSLSDSSLRQMILGRMLGLREACQLNYYCVYSLRARLRNQRSYFVTRIEAKVSSPLVITCRS